MLRINNLGICETSFLLEKSLKFFKNKKCMKKWGDCIAK